MKLSIIVPVYNMAVGGRLSFCLDSLLAQTLPADSYEIIAVDDASTDDSFAVLEQYAAAQPGRIRIHRSARNMHQGGAKNIGLKMAQGEWIGFMDADDFADPQMYAKLLQAAEEKQADISGCDYTMVDGYAFTPGQTVRNTPDGCGGELDEDKYRRLLLDPGSLCVKIFKREILTAGAPVSEEGDRLLVFPEYIFYEDNAVCRSFIVRARAFAYTQEPLYYYVQHQASTVHTVTKQRLLDRMEAGRRLMDEAKREGYLERFRPEIEFSFTVLFYINTLFSAMPKRFGLQDAYRFTRELGRQMKAAVPGFQENRYYLEKIPAEEQKLIRMQMRSHLLFYVYYRLLWAYRRFRYKSEN